MVTIHVLHHLGNLSENVGILVLVFLRDVEFYLVCLQYVVFLVKVDLDLLHFVRVLRQDVQLAVLSTLNQLSVLGFKLVVVVLQPIDSAKTGAASQGHQQLRPFANFLESLDFVAAADGAVDQGHVVIVALGR